MVFVYNSTSKQLSPRGRGASELSARMFTTMLWSLSCNVPRGRFHRLTEGIWHQANTVSGITAVVNHFEWVEYYHNYEIICKALHCVLRLFILSIYIHNSKLGFVYILRKWQTSKLQATKWFVSLSALILDNPGWEMISQGKTSCIKYLNSMGCMAPNKCLKFLSISKVEWSLEVKTLYLSTIS